MPTKEKTLFRNFKVTWKFHENLFSSVPKAEELVTPWLSARKPTVRPPQGKTIEEVREEVLQTMSRTTQEELEEQEELIRRISLGFQQNEGNIVVRGATVRAHLKECGRIIGRMVIGKTEGEYSLGWKVTNGLYVNEYFIPVVRFDGAPVKEPDGTKEIMVHAQGPRGPVNALKRVDYVQKVQITFTMKLLAGLNISDVDTIMQFGSVHGYAGERSMQEGRYEFSYETLDVNTVEVEVSEPKAPKTKKEKKEK